MTASPAGAAVTRLSELALTIRSATSLDDVASAVAEASLVLLAADTVRVLRIDSAHGRIHVLHRAGLVEPGVAPQLPATYLLADYSVIVSDQDNARTRRSALSDPAISERDLNELRNLGACACLQIPITLPGTHWGSVYATRQHDVPFTDADVATAEVIGTLAGAAIDRLERHDDLQRLALTDPMTGLANRRAVDELLERWASDPTLSRTMTVVLCDVNGLKRVNDTFGHASGDQLICETANVIAACSGFLPDAMAARIGGDEFLIASPAADRDRIARVLDELVASAGLLPLGEGLSCGAATGADIIREDIPPAARVRALLRMADAEQYRHKMASRARRAAEEQPPDPTASAPASAPTWSSPDRGSAMATVVAVTDHLRSTDDPMEVRLGLVAAAVCEVAFGAAWWVSDVDVSGGTIRTRHCGTPRAEGDRDGAWSDVTPDPTEYLLSGYPASAQAVTGRSFAVDLERGDDAERHLLLELGFSSVIGSGGPGPVTGEAWLVEVYGDALTPQLAQSEALLHVMTALALHSRAADVLVPE